MLLLTNRNSLFVILLIPFDTKLTDNLLPNRRHFYNIMDIKQIKSAKDMNKQLLFKRKLYCYWGFLGGLDKQSCSMPGSGRSPENEWYYPLSILALKNLRIEKPCGYSPWVMESCGINLCKSDIVNGVIRKDAVTH